MPYFCKYIYINVFKENLNDRNSDSCALSLISTFSFMFLVLLLLLRLFTPFCQSCNQISLFDFPIRIFLSLCFQWFVQPLMIEITCPSVSYSFAVAQWKSLLITSWVFEQLNVCVSVIWHSEKNNAHELWNAQKWKEQPRYTFIQWD